MVLIQEGMLRFFSLSYSFGVQDKIFHASPMLQLKTLLEHHHFWVWSTRADAWVSMQETELRDYAWSHWTHNAFYEQCIWLYPWEDEWVWLTTSSARGNLAKPSVIEEPSQRAEFKGTNTKCEYGVDGQVSVLQSPIHPPAHASHQSILQLMHWHHMLLI